MRDPKRILGKVLKSSENLDIFEKTGEPLEQLVDILRNIIRCRRTRQWISDNYQVDLIVSPKMFTRLLDIPQINFIENSNRVLEVNTVSLKEIRNSTDPVTIGNLNSILRELYRNLESIQGQLENKHTNLLLINEMSPELIGEVDQQIKSIKRLNGRLTGYMLSLNKVKPIELNFENLFPSSTKIGSLRKIWPVVEEEVEFYKKCCELNKRWEAVGIDLFKVIREDGLSSLRENIQELGNLLWNIVYNQRPLEQSLTILQIDFNDTRSLFDSSRIELNNV